jgi:uncharacterized integral membrane protein
VIILGFLLIIVAVAAAVILIVANTGNVDVSALGQTWTVAALWLVVAGLVAMAVAVIGVVLIRQARPRIPQVRGAHERLVPAQAPTQREDTVETQREVARDDQAPVETGDQPPLPLTRNEPGGSS